MTRFDDIRLLRIRYLRGPNIWTYRPCSKSGSTWASSRTFPPT